MAEFWDLYDENGVLTGRTWRRDEESSLPKGLYHLVVGIWTVNTNHEILLTKRSPEKPLWPLSWENSGGSALSGETSPQAAMRELFEETGILARQDELHFVNRDLGRTAIVDNYILRRDIPITALTLQKGETCDAKWVSLNTLDAMIASGEIAEPISRRLRLFRHEFENFLFAR